MNDKLSYLTPFEFFEQHKSPTRIYLIGRKEVSEKVLEDTDYAKLQPGTILRECSIEITCKLRSDIHMYNCYVYTSTRDFLFHLGEIDRNTSLIIDSCYIEAPFIKQLYNKQYLKKGAELRAEGCYFILNPDATARLNR